MRKLIFETFRLLRPRQWIKNFAIFAAIIFAGKFFDWPLLQEVIIAFFVFCGLSSAIYIINDIFDIEKDRLHPFKKFRPLASGKVPIPFAVFIAISLVITALLVGYSINLGFFLLILIYLVLQLSYSVLLKNIAIIDILALAAGYILRVSGGEFATGLHISAWLLLTTISLSLFLAVGKRRSELTLVSSYSGTHIASIRKSLSHYSEPLLDVYASVFATSTFLSYSLFTFLENSSTFTVTNELLMPDFLPIFLQRKWLMVTILPVVYGIMRYLQDIYEKHEGESPEKLFLSDKPLLATVIIWLFLVLLIIYGLTD